MVLRVGIVVGEPSGDLLGSQLINTLKEKYPTLVVEGVVGQKLIDSGATQLYSMDNLSVMGFIEPLLRLHKLISMRRWLIKYFTEDPPDLFIGIDSPDFNLGLEKILRKSGIPIVHYVSPSVWAWRQGRVKKIEESVDLMLALFPFEEQFYKNHNIPVCFTGHPTADKVPMSIDKDAAKKELGFASTDNIIAILPGSRNSELKNMVKIYLNVVKICSQDNHDLKFVMPLLYEGHAAHVEHWRSKICPNTTIKYVIANSKLVMSAADIALVTSGTATLELMLYKIPMIVAYKTNWITYKIVQQLIKVKYIALPNLLSDRGVVPEFIQKDAVPELIAIKLLELIKSDDVRSKQVEIFQSLHKKLQQGASIKAAAAIYNLLGEIKEVEYADSGR